MQGGYYGKTIKTASYEGHKQGIEPSLDKGANVNAQGGKYGNTLGGFSWRARGDCEEAS